MTRVDSPSEAPDTDSSRSGRAGAAPALREVLRWAPRVVVAACCIYVFWRERPDLLFRDTTPAGGDMGAHVWWPAYLRDHLLSHWRISGWSPDWFAGFPAGRFYFPLPSLLIVLLDVVLPYNVAFKLVTAAGPVALPAAAYAFARGIKVPRPGPPLLAIAAVAFMFFKGDPGKGTFASTASFNQHIMGGNLLSNLAGEFSFTIALALALCFLGALAVALDRHRRLALPAVLFAATVLSHIVVGIFAIFGALVIWALHRPVRNVRYVVVIGGVGALLTGFWTIPLLSTFGYTANMRYERLTHYVGYLFPHYLWWVELLALVALVVGLLRFRVSTFTIAAITGIMGLTFRFWPEAGAWNLRFLPFWYLGLFLLAAIGVSEAVDFASSRVTWMFEPGERGAAPATRRLTAALTAVALMVAVSGFALVRIDETRGAILKFWPVWNYSGLENTKGVAAKAYPELSALVEQLDRLPPGRALWEGGQALDRYGTPDVLMLLPYLTHGRIASMEGLYYESAATTPYHFLMASKLTLAPSNPVRGLQYQGLASFPLGVRQMQLFGVRYYLAFTPETKARAAADGRLRLVATTPDVDHQPPQGWSIYEVRDAPLVQPLTEQPVVVTHLRPRKESSCYGTAPPVGAPDPTLTGWECTAARWFDAAAALDRPLAQSGPSSWARAPADVARAAPRRRLPTTKVSRIATTDQTIRFHVSRTGVPVLVKESYFPNWKVTGAKGVSRVTPNLMVVTPTSHDVVLEFSTTRWDRIGVVASVAGLAGLVGLALWRPDDALRRRRRPAPSSPPATGPAPLDDDQIVAAEPEETPALR